MKRSPVALGAIAILSLCLVVASAQQKPKLKVFISADMEGISGIVHGDQTTPGTAEYADGRQWMALAFTADDYIEGFRTLRALISLAPAR